jgi:ABC-type branched-subunit amino acid transport system substrate-binding protein
MEYFAAQLQNQIDTSFKDLGIVPQIAICLDPQSPDNQVFKKIFTNLGEALGRQYKQLNCGVFENINATKIKEIVSEIRESRSNALMVSPHINSVGKAMDLLKAIRNEPGLSNIQLFGGPSFYTHVAENNGVGNAGISTDGLTVSVPYFPNPKNIFVKEYAKQWGENLNNWRTPMAYSSTKLVNELLQKKPSRQGLNDLLISTKLFSTQVIDDFYFNTSNELEYIHSSSSKGVLIKLKDQKFTLIKKLD